MAKGRSVAFRDGCDFFLLFFCETSLADQISLPDDHAPIGVMGDHAHKAGEWMLFYRYGFMKMDGNRDCPQLRSNYSFTIGWQLSI